jgi:hypothetical protein
LTSAPPVVLALLGAAAILARVPGSRAISAARIASHARDVRPPACERGAAITPIAARRDAAFDGSEAVAIALDNP